MGKGRQEPCGEGAQRSPPAATCCREPARPKADPRAPEVVSPLLLHPCPGDRPGTLQLLCSAVILLPSWQHQQMGWRGTKLKKTSAAYWKLSLLVESPGWDFCPLSTSFGNSHRSRMEKMSARMKAPGQPNKPSLCLQIWRLTSCWQRLSPPWRWLGPARVCEEDSHLEVTPAELPPHSPFSKTTKRRWLSLFWFEEYS